jgi:TPR repeat protein
MRKSIIVLLFFACVQGEEPNSENGITSWREGRSWRPLQSVFSKEIKVKYSEFVSSNSSVSFDANNKDAAMIFATALINARSSDRNPAFGLILLSKLADIGETRALVELSRCYFDGVIFRRDLSKAREYATIAIKEKEDRSAYNVLARIELAAGDRAAAIKSAEEGILNEDGESYAVLSSIMGAGNSAIPEDKKIKIYELLDQGSRLGNLNSKRGLAKCLESGYGCEVNRDKTYAVYQQLYQTGDPSAAMWLASLNFEVWKRDKNNEKAKNKVIEYTDAPGLCESELFSVAMRLRALVFQSVEDGNIAIYSELASIANQHDAKVFSRQVSDFLSVDRAKSHEGQMILKDFFTASAP